MKQNKYSNKHWKNYLLVSLLFLFFGLSFLIFPENIKSIQIDKNLELDHEPRSSGIWATLDLTNPLEVNNTLFPHYTNITIKGRLYNRLDGTNKSGYLIGISINGAPKNKFNDTTDAYGKFEINYTVEPSLSAYSSHKINATVIQVTPDKVEYRHHYTIYTNATSYFDTDWLNSDDPSIPRIPGEAFSLNGYLRYDNGSGIEDQSVSRYWKNETAQWLDGSDNTYPVPLRGKFEYNLNIGGTNSQYITENISIRLVYSGEPGKTNASQIVIPIKLFKNITCIWNTISQAAEGDQITIKGRVVSRTNNSMGIAKRKVRILFDGNIIGIPTTDANGNFSYLYNVPTGIGAKSIQVEIVTALSLTLNSSTPYSINIVAGTGGTVDPPSNPSLLPPFQTFLMVFIPIISGIIAVLVVIGIRRLKKQEIESRSVKLPLEKKILNMKILKDTGRIEEALSYLFNAIYMDLVDAKFGRKRTVTETIRDFAIISVKDLNLNPTSIYPFITKVEEIIYARPFTVTNKDFYDSIALFSPIYYELTGYKFKLNF